MINELACDRQRSHQNCRATQEYSTRDLAIQILRRRRDFAGSLQSRPLKDSFSSSPRLQLVAACESFTHPIRHAFEHLRR